MLPPSEVSMVQCQLRILPNIGINTNKISVSIWLRLRFEAAYPNGGLSGEITAAKGFDDDQLASVGEEVRATIREHSNEEADSSGE